MKYLSFLFAVLLLLNACNSGVSEETKSQVSQSIKNWQQQQSGIETLEQQILASDTLFNKMLQDSLGEQGIKWIEKDSLSNEKIKSLKNDIQNLKNDYSSLVANYKTLLKETENWSSNLSQSTQSSDEINEEWDSKQRQVQELLSQKEAYEQAFNALKTNYLQTISDIKEKMKKK